MNVRAGYVCGMKENWVLFAIILAMGCDASQPPEPAIEYPVASEDTDAQEVEIDERIRRLVASDFPTLDDNNAASFLMDWGSTQGENRVTMDTKHGRIVVELYPDVPIHRANFLYKVYRRYYDPAEFTRVVPEFVVQGGNSEEERPQQLRFLIGQHTLPEEFQSDKIHVRGALAMSRSCQNNPDKRSSGYDFYIVTGRKISSQELGRIQSEKGWVYTPEQAEAYAQKGGAPHLDGEHTVFGWVVEGMDVVDRLAQTPRDGSDWPVERLEVRMNLSSEAPQNVQPF